MDLIDLKYSLAILCNSPIIFIVKTKYKLSLCIHRHLYVRNSSNGINVHGNKHAN